MAEGEFGGGPFNRLASGIKRAADAFTQTRYSGGVGATDALSQGGAAQQLGGYARGMTPPATENTAAATSAPNVIAETARTGINPANIPASQTQYVEPPASTGTGIGAPYTSVTKDAQGNPVITSIGGSPQQTGGVGGRYFNEAAQAAKEAELDNIINTAMANRSKTEWGQDLRWNAATKKAELVPVLKTVNAGRDSQLLATALAAKYGMGEKRMAADVEMEKARMGLEGHRIAAKERSTWEQERLDEMKRGHNIQQNQFLLNLQERHGNEEAKRVNDWLGRNAEKSVVSDELGNKVASPNIARTLFKAYTNKYNVPKGLKEDVENAGRRFESAKPEWLAVPENQKWMKAMGIKDANDPRVIRKMQEHYAESLK